MGPENFTNQNIFNRTTRPGHFEKRPEHKSSPWHHHSPGAERNYYSQNREFNNFEMQGREQFNRFENNGPANRNTNNSYGNRRDPDNFVNYYQNEENPEWHRFAAEYPEDDYRSGSRKKFRNPQPMNHYGNEGFHQENFGMKTGRRRFDEMQDHQHHSRNMENQGRNANLHGGYGGRSWNEYENDRDNRRHNNF